MKGTINYMAHTILIMNKLEEALFQNIVPDYIANHPAFSIISLSHLIYNFDNYLNKFSFHMLRDIPTEILRLNSM